MVFFKSDHCLIFTATGGSPRLIQYGKQGAIPILDHHLNRVQIEAAQHSAKQSHADRNHCRGKLDNGILSLIRFRHTFCRRAEVSSLFSPASRRHSAAMTPPQTLFHSLLRPAVLQILRAAGYHSAKTSVLDSMTELAARYFLHLCQLTAIYAAHNGSISDTADLSPTIVDVRLALQRAGALLPERSQEEQEYLGEEDMRGVEEFLAWATGPQNREIKRIALDGSDEAVDYLDGEWSEKPLSLYGARLMSCDSTQEEAQQERGRLQVPRYAARQAH